MKLYLALACIFGALKGPFFISNFNTGDDFLKSSDLIAVDERPKLLKTIPLSLQHLFAMFGSTVLVPILFGINPSTVLLMNGIGTLLYIFITKGQIPAYLGSSFAFIAPVTYVLENNGPEGYSYVLGGFLAVGVVLTLVGLFVKLVGTGCIDVLFLSPVVCAVCYVLC